MESSLSNNQTTSNPHQLIKLQDVISLTKKCRSNIYKDIKAGTFPKPLKIGSRAVAWKESEIQIWIDNLPRACNSV